MTEQQLTPAMVKKYQQIFHARPAAGVISRAIQKNGIKMLVKIRQRASVSTGPSLTKLRQGSRATSGTVAGAGPLRH